MKPYYMHCMMPVFIILACYCMVSILYAEGNQTEARSIALAMDAAIQQPLVKASDANDVKAVEELARVVQEQYWRHTYRICSVLVSRPMDGTSLSLQLANQYGLDALTQAELMPIKLNIELLCCLFNDSGTTKSDDEWVILRAKKAKLNLQAWKRLDTMIDPEFDFSVPMFINLMPPEGANIPAGGDPASIKDPEIRAQYEALIEENRKNIVAFNEQDGLRDLNKWYPVRVEKYLISIYSQAPYNIEELRVLLNLYVGDQAIRERILNAVAQQMGLK